MKLHFFVWPCREDDVSYGSGAMDLTFMQHKKVLAPAFEELNKRLVLGVSLVKYCYRIAYKKTWKYIKWLQICPCQVYITDTCASKTHPHSYAIGIFRSKACFLLFAFFKIHNFFKNWHASLTGYLAVLSICHIL